MDKEDVVCVCVYIYLYIYIFIYTRILLSHKKEQNFAICNNMDGLGGHCDK